MKLNKPVFQSDKNKEYTITYEVELQNKFFEEFSQINIDELSIEFIFPSNSNNLHPKLYIITLLERQKSLQEEIDLRRGITTKIAWNQIKKLRNKDLVRLEW